MLRMKETKREALMAAGPYIVLVCRKEITNVLKCTTECFSQKALLAFRNDGQPKVLQHLILLHKPAK